MSVPEASKTRDQRPIRGTLELKRVEMEALARSELVLPVAIRRNRSRCCRPMRCSGIVPSNPGREQLKGLEPPDGTHHGSKGQKRSTTGEDPPGRTQDSRAVRDGTWGESRGLHGILLPIQGSFPPPQMVLGPLYPVFPNPKSHQTENLKSAFNVSTPHSAPALQKKSPNGSQATRISRHQN